MSPSPSAQNVESHEMARSCRGCRRSRKGCNRKKPCGRCQERGWECYYYSDEAPFLPPMPCQQESVLASNASQYQYMTPSTSAQRHAFASTPIANETPAAIGLSADEAPIRSGQSIGSIIPVSSHQQRPAPTAYMGDYLSPTSSRRTPEAVGISQSPDAGGEVPDRMPYPWVTAKSKRKTDEPEAERVAKTKTQSAEQVTKIKVEFVDLTSSDDHKPHYLAQDAGNGQIALQSDTHSVGYQERATSTQPGPPTLAPSLGAVTITGGGGSGVAVQAAPRFEDQDEELMDLDLLRVAQLEWQLRQKKKQLKRSPTTGAQHAATTAQAST